MRRPDRYVTYYRVSTEGQGRSGLGLEAQKEMVARFLGAEDEVVGEFVEVETGKGHNALARRPKLRAALDECRKRRAKLVIAKLDRLARNARFLLELIDSGVEVVFTDIPETHGPMGRFIITNLAAFAELEAGLISERTKSALAAAKARGTRLGNPRLLADASAFAAERERRFRDRFMQGIDLGAAITEARAAGHVTMKRLADELNRRGVPTPRGRRWHASTLHTALARMEEAAIPVPPPAEGSVAPLHALPCPPLGAGDGNDPTGVGPWINDTQCDARPPCGLCDGAADRGPGGQG